jgi:hypothetical protein
MNKEEREIKIAELENEIKTLKGEVDFESGKCYKEWSDNFEAYYRITKCENDTFTYDSIFIGQMALNINMGNSTPVYAMRSSRKAKEITEDEFNNIMRKQLIESGVFKLLE